MYKIFFLSLFCLLVEASQFKDENIQIVAKNVTTEDSLVNATGEVVLFSQNYFITANRLKYDKKTGIIELFDEVSVSKNNEQISFSEYLIFDLKKETRQINPMLMLDNQTKLWFNATNASASKTLYDLEDATLSSCDCVNPAWSISFTSGDYDAQDQWINTYNATLFIKDFPILYTPYFGFSTDKTRRTGLLPPVLGFSKTEGLLYAQPIYYAPQHNYDMEFIPQIRTLRGEGGYFNYRYKDSQYSLLKLQTGLFQEQEEYQKQQKLVNEKHHGISLNYTRTNLFSNNTTNRDGLLIDFATMTDVDYINTRYDNDTGNYTERFLGSKINYYYNTYNYFADLQLKYYDDLQEENNDNVMQTLPDLNFHKYSTNLWLDKLTYSLDMQASRDTREVGIGADTTQIYLPLSYRFSLFDDFFYLSLSEQLNYTHIDYTNERGRYESVNYATISDIVSLSTDLLKPYESFFHTVNFSGTYNNARVIKEEGDIYNEDTNNDPNLKQFPITQSQKTVSFAFLQSFYAKETLKPIVTHKISQVFTYDDFEKKYEKQNLENDLVLYFTYGSLANRSLYSHQLEDIVSSVSQLNFQYDQSFFKFLHSYKKNQTTLINDEFINYELGTSFAKKYSLRYQEEYDMIERLSRKKQYIFGIDEKCWGLSLKYIDSIVATNTTDDSVIRDKIVYVELNLKQLFSLEQKYKLKQR